MRIYGDSGISIYYLEGAPSFKARATARLTALWGGRRYTGYQRPGPFGMPYVAHSSGRLRSPS